MRRRGPSTHGKRFVGNSDKKEVHDLDNEKTVEISMRARAKLPEIEFEVPVTNVKAENNSFKLTLGEKTSTRAFSTISIDRYQYNRLNRPTSGDRIKVNLELNLAVRSVKEKLASYRRTSWKPIVEDGDGPLDASKFSGKPWLSKDMEWPVCPDCNKPMQFSFS